MAFVTFACWNKKRPLISMMNCRNVLFWKTRFYHFSSFSFMHSFFALRILCTSLRSKTSNRFSCELNSPTNGQKLNESHVPQQNICKPSFGRALLRREKNPNQQYGRMLANQMALRDSRQSGGELRFRNRKHPNKIRRFDTEPYFRGWEYGDGAIPEMILSLNATTRKPHHRFFRLPFPIRKNTRITRHKDIVKREETLLWHHCEFGSSSTSDWHVTQGI